MNGHREGIVDMNVLLGHCEDECHINAITKKKKSMMLSLQA